MKNRRLHKPTPLAKTIAEYALQYSGEMDHRCKDPSCYYIRRTYAGHWQRSAGALSWELWYLPPNASRNTMGNPVAVGGYAKASEIGKAIKDGKATHTFLDGTLIIDFEAEEVNP